MADAISVKDLQTRLSEGRAPALFDVRRENDFKASPQKIVGAKRRDPEQIERWLDRVPADADVVVYCVKGGSVSQSVATQLEGKGYRVKFLEGGILAWSESGGEVA